MQQVQTKKVSRETVHLLKLDKPVALNFVALQDEAWFDEQQLSIGRAFQALDSNEATDLLHIFWRLLDDESKGQISKLKFMKWDGTVGTPYVPTDHIDLLKHVISGSQDIFNIVMGLRNTFEKSYPVKNESDKKKVMGELSSQTPRSTISSQQSTDSMRDNLTSSPEEGSPSL